ncbi:hypothetical protein HMPREF3188_00400 [Tissierellia bacterium KA00581]|nr:hypothetical protein HMPREF3188_00400 [Tissierellia bacterium KA00581]
MNMDNLYNYFLRYNEKINFLTIKNIKIENREYTNIDFPINSKVLLKNIKENTFKNEISTKYFIEGIILLNAIDSSFNNIEILNKFLNSFKNDTIINIVKSKLYFKNLTFDNILYNVLILRGLVVLNKINDYIKKLYIKNLIMILDYLDENFKALFLNEIKLELSKLFFKNENDPYINILYGDLNLKEKFYIKSNSFYVRALNFSNDRFLKENISNKISSIKVKVEIENLLQLIDKFQYEKALKILSTINDDKNLDKEDYYWIAYSYNKLNETNLAIKYYEKSLKLNADFLNIFIELGLLYYKINKINKALKIFEDGLNIYIDDEKLMFNKIILELKLNMFEKAKKDIDKILLYEDLDNTIMNDILYLKNLYENDLNK